MNELSKRISTLIESLGLKKTAFADKINVSQAFVSQLCAGTKQPSDRTIADICREFNVNEEWLRTGQGEMFKPLSRSEVIAGFAGELLKTEEDSFKRRLIELLAELDESEWEMLEQLAKKLTEKKD